MKVQTWAMGTLWTDREPVRGGVRVTQEVNERSVADVALLTDATLRFERGDGVRIRTDDDELLFNGFVDTVEASRIGLNGTRRQDLSCVDLHWAADKRVIAAAYTDMTAGDIVRDILATILNAEDVWEGTIEDGPVVRAISFNYVPVSDALTELAQRAGFWWAIDQFHSLHFANPVPGFIVWAGDAGALAGDANSLAGEAGESGELDIASVALADSVVVRRHAHSYRNRQWIRAARDQTVLQIETRAGDGEATAFLLSFAVAQEPVVEVSRAGGAYVTETVGAAGIQEDRQWRYSYGSHTISQGAGEAVLSSADRVRVSYNGMFSIIATVQNEPEQYERAAIEGNTGIVERVLADSSIDSGSAAFQLAAELLAYHGRNALEVMFETRSRTDLRPGQLMYATLPEAGIDNEEVMIASVEHFTVADEHRAVVTLVAGPIEGSWAQWLGALSRRIDKVADPSGEQVEIITTFHSFEKVWAAVESPNLFQQTRAGTAVAGAGTFPEFTPSERVRFMAWFAGGVELGRRQITSASGMSTSTISTTTILVATDAVGSIEELAWFGGNQASHALGSGFELERVPFVMEKTSIEQVQVDRTDIDGSAQ